MNGELPVYNVVVGPIITAAGQIEINSTAVLFYNYGQKTVFIDRLFPIAPGMTLWIEVPRGIGIVQQMFHITFSGSGSQDLRYFEYRKVGAAYNV